MKPAKQARSEQTLRRLVAAAEQVLRDKNYKDAGVLEIAGAAGVTVGALYFRFADKEALFVHLEEITFSELGERLTDAFRPLRKGEGFEVRMGDALAELAAFYVEHRGVARAVAERSRADKALDSKRAKRTKALFDHACDWIEKHYAPARKAGRMKVNTALLFATTALRERILFRDFWPGDGVPDTADLCRELASAMTSYLRSSASR